MARNKSIKVFFALFVASVWMIAAVHSQVGVGSEDLDNSENSDDLETAEFFIWPKLLLAKAALGKAALLGGGLALTKTVQVNTKVAPLPTYSYRPVTYTAYKWVPVPYQYTVQQPYIDSSKQTTTTKTTPYLPPSSPTSSYSSAAAPTADSLSTVVRAPFVSVDIQKTVGFNSGVGSTSTAGSGSSSSSASSFGSSSTSDNETDI